ncbi:hypothetical protein D3C80_982070 [compost metagenome]
MGPGDQYRKTETLADHAAHHLDGRRAEHDVRCQAQLFEDTHEIGAARLHVEQDHRLQRQVAQGYLGLLGKTVPLRQQGIRALRRHQRFGLDGCVQVVFIENRQVEAPAGQALHQLLLLAVLQTDLDAGVAFAKTCDQAGQVEWGDCLETTDIDLPADHVVIGQGVLFELLGHAQQFPGLAVKACTARGERHALGMVTDEQLHAETLFQPLDRRGNGRLGDVQLARGFGDAAAFHGGDEVLQLAQGVGSHGKPRRCSIQAPTLPRRGRQWGGACFRFCVAVSIFSMGSRVHQKR